MYLARKFLILCLLFGHGIVVKADSNEGIQPKKISLSKPATFTLTLQTKQKMQLSLLHKEAATSGRDQDSTVGWIDITDQNCTGGHKGKITVAGKANARLTTYFEKELPWGNSFEISIKREGLNLTLKIGEEEIVVRTIQSASYVEIAPTYAQLINTK